MGKLQERHKDATGKGITLVCSIGGWAKLHGVSRRTAARDLQALERLGYVEAIRHETQWGTGYTWELFVYPELPGEGMQDE